MLRGEIANVCASAQHQSHAQFVEEGVQKSFDALDSAGNIGAQDRERDADDLRAQSQRLRRLQTGTDAARRDLEAARAEVSAASTALGMVGTDDGNAGTYVLRAPIAGVVTRRAATVGTLVDTDDPLFEIIDTTRLWAEIDVPEASLGTVRVGQRVVLEVDGIPGREFLGEVNYLSPVIDPQTRTIVMQKKDRETGETVSQLPDETLLKLRAYSRELSERAREDQETRRQVEREA